MRSPVNMVSLQPADPGRFFVKVMADQHYQKGVQFEQAGDWEQALHCYRRASGLDLGSVLFLLARGHICQEHGLEAEADECYRLALRLRPDDTVVLYNQALLFAARGQLDAARANLAKVAAGDLEGLGDRAAPIFCRLGDIALRKQDYPAAGVYFRRALECAPEHRYALAALDGLERFAEFEAPFATDGKVAPKVAVYGYTGAIVLGMPGDDGIDVPAYPGLGFESLHEVAQCLARSVGLARRAGWVFDAVVALDAESQPLAVALGAVLQARPVSSPDGLGHCGMALGVTAAGADPASVGEAMAALAERAGRTLFYAVGLTQPVWEYRPAAQMVSVPVRLEFPWNRREAAALEHAEAFGAELAALLARAADDPSLEAASEAQLRWYAGHARLATPLSFASVAPA